MNDHTYRLVHAQLPTLSSSEDLLANQLFAGASVVLVDAAKAKLDDYVKPLGQMLEKSSEPVLLLVATRQRLQELRGQFEEELGGRQEIYEVEHETQLMLRRNGLWIMTTAQLAKLLEQSQPLLKDVHFQTVVFDGLHQLQAYGGSCFQALKLELWKLCSTPQLVVTSSLWLAAEMRELLQHAKQPLVWIREPLEAAVYGGLQLRVELSETRTEQLQQLVEYLKLESPEKQRTLIYCSCESDFQVLQQQLPKDSYLLHRGRQDMNRLEHWQQQLTGKILLLRAHSPELLVENVQSLIHFNMPATWSQFRRSFAVLKNQIHNVLLANTEQQQPLHSLILLNTESQRMLPQLLEFMQQHGQPVAKELSTGHAQLQATREATLVSRQCVICPMLLLDGRCLKPTCQYRHVLSARDKNCGTVPRVGFIRFQLLKICTPTHFAARLLAHRSSIESSWLTLPAQQQYADLQEKLSTHYDKPEHCIVPTLEELQQICVRRMGNDSYERVCVTFVPAAAAPSPARGDLTVRIRYLDLSTVICHAKLSELLVCPLALQQSEPMALDVRLIGWLPYNGEEIWQSCDTAAIAELLQHEGIYEARVYTTLAHTIFVDELQLEAVSYAEQLHRLKLSRFDVEAKKRLEEFVKAIEGDGRRENDRNR
ncbi:putative ATP-dependent RNA helicase BoYb isoform X1 [Drosophila mojavensis]|uniref:putative ATP-dependent RNA helicase BoYb isoform X1 n=1 Tax=Drosophila mojavensis TaxID=7230 RepID=UPI001CD0AA0B|nr:putative ATP-dependent RNA helicase BoYb isoform X1 [Drosophila mojavensis]